MALVMFEVVVREQHLRDPQAVPGEQLAYVAMSCDWPTAAQAESAASSVGRFSRPSAPMPAADCGRR